MSLSMESLQQIGLPGQDLLRNYKRQMHQRIGGLEYVCTTICEDPYRVSYDHESEVFRPLVVKMEGVLDCRDVHYRLFNSNEDSFIITFVKQIATLLKRTRDIELAEALK